MTSVAAKSWWNLLFIMCCQIELSKFFRLEYKYNVFPNIRLSILARIYVADAGGALSHFAVSPSTTTVVQLRTLPRINRFAKLERQCRSTDRHTITWPASTISFA